MVPEPETVVEDEAPARELLARINAVLRRQTDFVQTGLPQDKLWVTVYQTDDEAHDVWAQDIGVPRRGDEFQPEPLEIVEGIAECANFEFAAIAGSCIYLTDRQANLRRQHPFGCAFGQFAEQEKKIAEYRRRIQLCNPVGDFVNDQVSSVNFLYCHEDYREAARAGLRRQDRPAGGKRISG